jgi:predicted nucleotidyltransferase
LYPIRNINTLSAYKNEINALCANHNVKSLYAFGSVLTPNFNTNSDIDLIVDFKEIDVKDYADNYFDFKFSLQDILNRPVDLLEEQAIKNPYFKEELNKKKVIVYKEI